MAKPGPKPLPANVHMLRGNPSKKPLASLLDDVVRPDVEIPECPAHLEGEAVAEWNRIAPHLQALGLISQIDRAALAAYCDTWGEYVETCEVLKALRRRFKSGDDLKKLPPIAREWFAGHVATTPSGYQQISIPVQHRNKLLEQMKSFLALFGMSPADRSRVTQSDARSPGSPEQGNLPGVDEKPKVGGWGKFE